MPKLNGSMGKTLGAKDFRWIFKLFSADGCLVVLNSNLVYIGGSAGRYRYADDPSKVILKFLLLFLAQATFWQVWVFLKRSNVWRDDIIPPLLANRMWHSCTVTTINGRVSPVFEFITEMFTNGFSTCKSGRDCDRRRLLQWTANYVLPSKL